MGMYRCKVWQAKELKNVSAMVVIITKRVTNAKVRVKIEIRFRFRLRFRLRVRFKPDSK